MPKITLTEAQQQRELLKSNLELLQGRKTNAEMGKIIGVNKDTYRSRKANPDTFTHGELFMLSVRFKIPLVDLVGKHLKISGEGGQP